MDLKEMVSSVVAKELERAGIKEVREQIEELNAKRVATPISPQPKLGVDKEAPSTLLVNALAAGRGRMNDAIEFASKTFGSEHVVTKALASNIGAQGGFLVEGEFANEIIELLQPASVFRRAGPVTVPLDSGSLRIPKITQGAQGGWLGENTNITTTEQVFGQIILTPYKYASVVPFSNDLLRRAAFAVSTVVRDDMINDIARSTDLAFLRGDGLGGDPVGISNHVLPANSFASAGTTLANVTTDLGTALQFMGDNNVRILRPAWFMEWRTWRHLITLRDGNGNLAFKGEMDGGTIFGIPFFITSQIPRNLGGGTETEIYLVEMSNMILGEATNVLIKVSDEAAYQDGATVRAALSLDQTVIRALIEVDMKPRHDESIVVVNTVTWGV